MLVYGLALLLLLVLPIAIGIRWYSKWRTPGGPAVPDTLTAPPAGVTPAYAAILVGGGERGRLIVGTLFDLARRGYATVRQLPGDTQFDRANRPGRSDLLAYEASLLDTVFGLRDTSRLSDLKEGVALREPLKALFAEFAESKWARRNAAGVRNAWLGTGQTLAVLGAIIVVLVVVFNSDRSEDPIVLPNLLGISITIWLGVIGAGMLLNGIILALLGSQITPLTAAGVEAKAKLIAFKTFLEKAKRFKALGHEPAAFADNLPYAVALGVEKPWIEAWTTRPDLADTPAPIWWYVGMGGYSPDHSFSSGGLAESGSGADLGGGFSLDALSTGMALSLNDISDGLAGFLDSTADSLGTSLYAGDADFGGSDSDGGWGGDSGGGDSGGGDGGGGDGGGGGE